MLFTDKLPGILDINGAPRVGVAKTLGNMRNFYGRRDVLAYINGVDSTDGFLFGSGTGPFSAYNQSIQVPSILTPQLARKSSTSAGNQTLSLSHAVRLDNDNWLYGYTTGAMLKINITTGQVDPVFAAAVGTAYSGPFRYFRKIGNYLHFGGDTTGWKGTTGYPRAFRLDLSTYQLDTTFAVGLLGGTAWIEPLSDGKYLLGRTYQTPNILRLNSDGTVDNAFTISMPSTYYVRSMVTRPSDGAVILAGDFVDVGGFAHRGVVAINPYTTSGTILSDYGSGIPTFSAGGGRCFSAVIGNDNELFLNGILPLQPNGTQQGIVCLKPDGSLNNSFKFQCTATYGGATEAITSMIPVQIGPRKLLYVGHNTYQSYINGTRSFGGLIDYTGRYIL